MTIAPAKKIEPPTDKAAVQASTTGNGSPVVQTGDHSSVTLNIGPQLAAGQFNYPEQGRHGPNILSNSTHTVYTMDGVSMRAEIPANSKLQVKLKMDIRKQTDAGWYYDISKISNWVNRGYEQPIGQASQLFDAEPGRADIELRFQQSGMLQIEVYEGEAKSPSWVRTVRVQKRIQH
ncbi:MAG: hypothetical protein HYX71_10915 [Opitutae bacterium]|nr:hypothetical protein [Opitutae bacterium]